MRGYAAVGLFRPKTSLNVGSALRAAFCFNAAMLAVDGERNMDIKSVTDTFKAYRHIPVLRGPLRELIPYDCIPVAVDLVEGATPLPSYQHPQRAFYIFGPEDGTLGKQILEWCPHKVMVPTRECMNLAASVNVILYDRMMKSDRMERGLRYRRAA